MEGCVLQGPPSPLGAEQIYSKSTEQIFSLKPSPLAVSSPPCTGHAEGQRSCCRTSSTACTVTAFLQWRATAGLENLSGGFWLWGWRSAAASNEEQRGSMLQKGPADPAPATQPWGVCETGPSAPARPLQKGLAAGRDTADGRGHRRRVEAVCPRGQLRPPLTHRRSGPRRCPRAPVPSRPPQRARLPSPHAERRWALLPACAQHSGARGELWPLPRDRGTAGRAGRGHSPPGGRAAVRRRGRRGCAAGCGLPGWGWAEPRQRGGRGGPARPRPRLLGAQAGRGPAPSRGRPRA